MEAHLNYIETAECPLAFNPRQLEEALSTIEFERKDIKISRALY